ncbi:hypothetical protein HY008_03755 [Candidatus Woesebacteria bacterium]|nr:hypothetical protein [Candidatus Woesebacteria bacterium]
MKRLLILVDSIGPKKELFAEGILKRFPTGYQVSLARFSDLIFKIDGKNISIRIDGIKKEITDFDLVYFRRAGTKFFSLAGTLAICLDYLNIPYFDTTFSQVGPDEDKFTNLTRLSLAGLPEIPTFFCWHNKIEDKKNEIIVEFGLPLIAKQLSLHRGKGVILIKGKDDFKRLPKEFPQGEFMFQKYYESKVEYRVLVLKNTVGAYETKIPQKGEWRGNVALGAKEEFLNVKKIPGNLKKIAIEAARTLNIQIAGVDILVDKVGRIWLLEVNRGPGITYDDKVSYEMANLAAFFAEELKKSK